MSQFAMISGRLLKAAEARTSKTGKPFATATVRVGDRDLTVWWSIVAFAEIGEDLLKLEAGDSVSVSGPFSTETYVAKDGGTKVSHKLSADRLASPRIGRAAHGLSRDGKPSTRTASEHSMDEPPWDRGAA